jgi:hypothetical protein
MILKFPLRICIVVTRRPCRIETFRELTASKQEKETAIRSGIGPTKTGGKKREGRKRGSEAIYAISRGTSIGTRSEIALALCISDAIWSV